MTEIIADYAIIPEGIFIQEDINIGLVRYLLSSEKVYLTIDGIKLKVNYYGR